MSVHITDSMDVDVDLEVESLYIENAFSTQHCDLDDGAPDDRANKCFLNNRSRRRMLALQDTTSSLKCMYVRSYVYAHT